jgi:hypothetical protein
MEATTRPDTGNRQLNYLKKLLAPIDKTLSAEAIFQYVN